MNWSNFIDNVGLWVNEFIDWYLIQPVFVQVLVIIGLVAVFALTITLVYYIIKGIAYLVYYIIKGIYYLLKSIGYGFYKLFEGFYLLVSGKPKNLSQENTKSNDSNDIINKIQTKIEFCSECGEIVSNKLKKHLLTKGMVYCVNCGNQFTLIHTPEPISIS
jgi:hypothetical protein